MTPREELEALRRLAELEAKAKPREFMAGSVMNAKPPDPTEGNSFLQNAAIGAGKAVSDTGLGVRQLASYAGIGDQEAIQQEVDERKNRDAPLMSTGGGITGNIGGHIAMTALPAGVLSRAPGVAGAAGRAMISAPANLTGAATSAGVGAAQAFMQPVASDESRGVNTAIGAAAGGAIPVAGMAFKGAKALLEPLYGGGRDAIVGRAMRSAAGTGSDDAVRALMGARELVPGSQPTAAQVANNGGVAALERTARAIDPQAYAARDLDQNAARVAALRGIAKGQPEMDAALAVRESVSAPLYKTARAGAADIRTNPELIGRPSLKAAWEQAGRLARESGELTVTPDGKLTGAGLHYMKLALDDQISVAQRAGNSNEMRLLMTTRDDLRKFMEQAIPPYKAARETYADLSKPINQMEVGQHLLNKLQPALSDFGQNTAQRGATYAQALRDAPRTIKGATGFGGYDDLSQILTPEQMMMAMNVARDLARKTNAEQLGRGVGSDTVQKLAMNNVMESAGLPRAIGNLPGVAAASKLAYGAPEEMMRQRLAQALLNPQEAAMLMQRAVPNPRRAAMARALTAGTVPLLTGSTVSALNAAQQ